VSAGLPAPGARLSERLVLGGALLASLILVWLATRQLVALAAFAGGLGAFGAIVWALTRARLPFQKSNMPCRTGRSRSPRLTVATPRLP